MFDASLKDRRSLARTRVSVLALATVLTILLAACSGGGNDSKAGAPRTTAKAQSATTTAPANSSPTSTEAAANLKPCDGSGFEGTQTASGLSGTNGVGVIALTRTGKGSCRLSGYPTITLLDTDGKQGANQTAQGGGAVPADLAASDVAVGTGDQASFVMSWSPVPSSGQSSSCLTARSIKVLVSPGGKAIPVKTVFTACGDVNVSPFQPGVVANP